MIDPTFRLILIGLASYLVGSFPTAVLISKRFFGFDIRTKGSGNMGSSNAFRLLGWKWGVVVQVIDILKGTFAVLVVSHLMEGHTLPFTNRTPFEDYTVVKLIAGASVVLGHIFSIFVGFKGGKGVNTATGMLIGIAPIEVSIAFGVFWLAVMVSGYISLGSILAAIIIPSVMAFRYNVFGAEISGYHTLIWFSIGMSLLVIYMHRSNIQRLLHGTERKMTQWQILRRHKQA